MKNRCAPGIMLIVLVLSLALGAYLIYIYNNLAMKTAESRDKIVIQNIEADTIGLDDAIILEQRYSKCGHTLTAPCQDQEQFIGKSLAELQKQFTVQNGFQFYYADQTLIIKQEINDWCPVDKAKCRLKEYQGRIAVYQGPTEVDDVLMRVTDIGAEALPNQIRKAIANGEYEFENMERLNDALENLDEYL